MNKVLWSCAALFAVFVTAEALKCYTCDWEVLGACLKTIPVNCAATDNRCYKAVADFTGDLLKIHERGCIAENGCVNQTGSILNVNYTITRYCCETDLCNGATSIQLPVTAALCAAIVAVWSQRDL